MLGEPNSEIGQIGTDADNFFVGPWWKSLAFGDIWGVFDAFSRSARNASETKGGAEVPGFFGAANVLPSEFDSPGRALATIPAE